MMKLDSMLTKAKQEEDKMIEKITNDTEKLQQIYERVVEAANKELPRKGLIKCPDCSEEILVIPSLKLMSKAIQNHIQGHREQLKSEPIKEYQTAIRIRLSLMEQIMQQACRLQIP